MDVRNIVSELDRRAFEARVDLTGLRRELAAAFAEADRRSAELDGLDAGPTLARRFAACTLFFLLLLPLALFLGAAS